MKDSSLLNSGAATIKLLLLKKVAGSSHYETSMGNKNAKGIGCAIFEIFANDELDFGDELIRLFGLKPMRGCKDLYKTSIGTKTKQGLYLSVLSVFKDETFRNSIIR